MPEFAKILIWFLKTNKNIIINYISCVWWIMKILWKTLLYFTDYIVCYERKVHLNKNQIIIYINLLKKVNYICQIGLLSFSQDKWERQLWISYIIMNCFETILFSLYRGNFLEISEK